ncbi:hypothetical protein F2P79_025059 [Pimephales promelas]|nr:hypothetical protein F2P79_025059 [Pimephales promelas]
MDLPPFRVPPPSLSVSLSPKLAGLQCLFQSFLGVGFGTSGISYSLLSFNPTVFPVGPIPGSWCLTAQVQPAPRSTRTPPPPPRDDQLINPQSAIANLPLYLSQRERNGKWISLMTVSLQEVRLTRWPAAELLDAYQWQQGSVKGDWRL